MAGTVPALLGRVPVHMAAEMRAGRGVDMQLATHVAADGEFSQSLAQDAAFSRAELVGAAQFAGGHILCEVLNRAQVLAHEVREAFARDRRVPPKGSSPRRSGRVAAGLPPPRASCPD